MGRTRPRKVDACRRRSEQERSRFQVALMNDRRKTTTVHSMNRGFGRFAAAMVLTALMLVGGATSPTAARSLVAVVTTYPAAASRGVLATSGGWAYCVQARPLARHLHLTLVCGRYIRDGYTGPGLRHDRWLDWGNPAYLSELAATIARVHRRTGGVLVLAGVSYSGYAVGVLAARHPELRPDRLVIVDSYLNLQARRSHLADSHETAREIDRETGGTATALMRRSPNIAGLVQLIRTGTDVRVVWTISAAEQREFGGATCDAPANAATLASIATRLGRPMNGWVTRNRHGVTFWRYGTRLIEGQTVGTKVEFVPGGAIPPGAVCE